MTTQRPVASRLLPLAVLILLSAYCRLPSAFGQNATATLSGTVEDQNGAAIPGVTITVVNKGTQLKRDATTNDEGNFTIPLLPPGGYTVRAQGQGFAPAEFTNMVLNVGDQKALKIELKAGDVNAQVQVISEALLINESPAVGTVVDRQFVGNIPLNARSLHSLITLVPGVVLAPGQAGQFSVNGQRANANYFIIDGVSANIGMNQVTVGAPADYAGSLPSLTTFGGTNNLISIDALEEFQIQTSTYAAEFGRSPGAQISMLSRSGTNAFHGSLFEYFRNDVLDANDWFANRAGLNKPPLRQNQFGGVLGGPIFKNGTFFFFSYEGLRLRQPQTGNNVVPALRLRQNAPAAVKTLLNAWPLPTGPEIGNSGQAPFTAVYSNPISMNATSIRVDHTFSPRLTLFGRYNQAPSRTVLRTMANLANMQPLENDTRTFTLGGTLFLTAHIQNEFRANYSRTRVSTAFQLDNFGGAVPFSPSDVIPPSVIAVTQAPMTEVNLFGFSMTAAVTQSFFTNNLQRQLNFLDNISYLVGPHDLKFGLDYRHLAPKYRPRDYDASLVFDDSNAILTGTLSSADIIADSRTSPLFTNFSAYAQDTWKAARRITLTYGLRWDVNTAPKEADGKQAFVVQGFENPQTATVSLGKQLWKTTYNNFAPRVSLAYQLFRRQSRQLVLRAGFGLFYDLGSGVGAAAFTSIPPFTATNSFGAEPYPLTPTQWAPPQLGGGGGGLVFVFDPNLKLPYTYQWNVAAEQAFGTNQSVTASYVAAVGRRLLNRRAAISPAGFLLITDNGATSDYQALQLRFQRRLSRGLQTLASYTWSHAIDEFSDENSFDFQTIRGDGNFDLRHNFSGAFTYDIPSPSRSSVVKALLANWEMDTVIRAQSAYPFTPRAGSLFLPNGNFFFRRPDLVPGVPVYVHDPNSPGGRRVNPMAFRIPAAGQQGNAGRNLVRGLGTWQIDFGLHRTFPLGERLKLVFRWEAFNVFNHPNFGAPNRNLTSPFFGQPTTMLSSDIGGLSPLYQTGGPRSMQFALRLEF